MSIKEEIKKQNPIIGPEVTLKKMQNLQMIVENCLLALSRNALLLMLFQYFILMFFPIAQWARYLHQKVGLVMDLLSMNWAMLILD